MPNTAGHEVWRCRRLLHCFEMAAAGHLELVELLLEQHSSPWNLLPRDRNKVVDVDVHGIQLFEFRHAVFRETQNTQGFFPAVVPPHLVALRITPTWETKNQWNMFEFNFFSLEVLKTYVSKIIVHQWISGQRLLHGCHHEHRKLSCCSCSFVTVAASAMLLLILWTMQLRCTDLFPFTAIHYWIQICFRIFLS